MKAMAADKHGEFNILELRELTTPEPDDNEILIRVFAAGVNPVDTYILAGTQGYTATFPHIPGKDGAGIVEKTGSGVTKLKKGDRVFFTLSKTGSFSTHTICNSEHVFKLGDNVSFELGAASGISAGAAYRALFQKTTPSAGETILIHGASGAVGLAAVQMAVDAELNVIATVGSEEGEKAVAGKGVKTVLNHRNDNHFDELNDYLDGKGIDIILEMLADQNLGQDLPLLNKGGRVIIIGSRGKVEMTPRDLMKNEAEIKGMVLFNASAVELNGIFSDLSHWLEDGRFAPVINKVFPLKEAAEAMKYLMTEKKYGSVVVTIN